MTGEQLFEMWVKAGLSFEGGPQGYRFDALTLNRQDRWNDLAKSIDNKYTNQIVEALKKTK